MAAVTWAAASGWPIDAAAFISASAFLRPPGHTALPQLAVRDTAGEERLRVAGLLLERCVEVTQRILVLAQLLGAESAEVVLLPLVALLRRERLPERRLGLLPLALAVHGNRAPSV